MFRECTCPFVKCFPCGEYFRRTVVPLHDAGCRLRTVSNMRLWRLLKHVPALAFAPSCSQLSLWRCRGWSDFPGRRLPSAQTGSHWWSASCRRVFQTCACGKCSKPVPVGGTSSNKIPSEVCFRQALVTIRVRGSCFKKCFKHALVAIHRQVPFKECFRHPLVVITQAGSSLSVFQTCDWGNCTNRFSLKWVSNTSLW